MVSLHIHVCMPKSHKHHIILEAYLERCFEPERGCHDEDLLQPRRVGALQKGEHLLAEVVVKIGVLGVRHVVYEYQAPALCLGLEYK